MKCAWAVVGMSLGIAIVTGGSDSARAAPDSDEKASLNRALRMEARQGRIQRLRELLDRGADINSRADYGETALYNAVYFGRTKAALKLIQWGADVRATDDEDRTPLLRAAEDCNYRVVRALVKGGAEINGADHFGRTPLINAVDSSCVRAVAVLLTLGRGRIHIDAQDHSYRSAMDYAKHPWIETMLKLAKGEAAPEGVTLPEISLP